MKRLPVATILLLAACAQATPAGDESLLREAIHRYSATGRTDEPIALLSRLLLRSPGHVEARLMRAGLYAHDGRRADALADYDAVVAADPGNAGARVSRALAQDLESCDQAALEDADACVKLRPTDETGWLLRGWIHRRAGRKSEAFADFETARTIGKASWATWHNAGVSSLTTRHLDEAERLFCWAAELDPARAETHMALGRVHVELGRPEQAAADFLRAADLSNDPEARLHLANTLLSLRRFGDARAEYDRVIGRDPASATAYFGRGMAKAGLGDAAAAEEDLGRCLRISPAHHEAWQQRAMLRIGQKRFAEAEEDLVNALKISATAEWVGRLADVYAERGDWIRARTTYASALQLCTDDALRKTLEISLERAKHEVGSR